MAVITVLYSGVPVFWCHSCTRVWHTCTVVQLEKFSGRPVICSGPRASCREAVAYTSGLPGPLRLLEILRSVSTVREAVWAGYTVSLQARGLLDIEATSLTRLDDD